MSLRACTMTLGGYQLLLSTIQGTKLFIHYIEGSTAQLVKCKALNIVDVGSSPMMGVTSYDVILIEEYIKSQLNIILLRRPLGATHCCSSLHDQIYKVPAHYLHNNLALGGYTGLSFYEHQAITSPRLLQAWQPGTWGLHMWNTQFWLVIEMNNLDFFKIVIFILKQVLSCSEQLTGRQQAEIDPGLWLC